MATAARFALCDTTVSLDAYEHLRRPGFDEAESFLEAAQSAAEVLGELLGVRVCVEAPEDIADGEIEPWVVACGLEQELVDCLDEGGRSDPEWVYRRARVTALAAKIRGMVTNA